MNQAAEPDEKLHEKKGRPGGERRLSKGKLLRFSLSAALVGAIFFFVLPQIADFSEVWAAISDMTSVEVVTLGLLAAWNLMTYWFVMTAATPGLTIPQAMVVTEASTAVSNTVPAGSAIAVGLTYLMLGSWGFSKSRSTLSVVVSGLWNNFAKLGLPVLALALLALQGEASASRVTAGLVGIGALVAAIVVFALMLRSEEFARKAGNAAARVMSKLRRVVGKGPATGWDDATAKFRARTITLVEKAWLRLTLATLVSHLSLFAVLLVTLRHVGVSNSEVNWVEALAVFAFVRLLTAVPLTPGGLGIVELGLITALTAAGGDKPDVVAAVLVFRILTYVLPIPFGLATYVFWRRNTSWHDSAPPLAGSSVPLPAGAKGAV